MTDYDEIQRIERRTRRYWFEDGISEIGIGTVFVVLAMYFVAENSLSVGRAGPFFPLLLPVLVVVLALSIARIVRAAKDRYVHPRTGYLSFPKPSNRRRLATAVIAATVSSAITLVLARLPEGAPWIPAGQGLLFAAAFWYIGNRADLIRFPLQGAAAAALGLALSWWRVPDLWAAAILFGATGVSVTFFGAVAFVRYLRKAVGGEA
ncbi:MAG: hypothetical protein ACE148_01075 [Vicinamibacterales bacterium]